MSIAVRRLVWDLNSSNPYVPNVVYSCGGIVHNDQLILPYGFADIGAAIALVPMERLLTALLEG